MGRASAESRGVDPMAPGDMSSGLYGLDEATLDPNMHYRWVAPRNFGRRVAQGYGMIRRSQSSIKFIRDEALYLQPSADDFFHKGESVLMACNKVTYRERRKRIEQVTEGRLASPKKRFKNKAEKQGVRVFDADTLRGEPKGDDE